MSTSNAPVATERDSARVTAIIAYALLLAGWPTLHLSTMAGVILAYVQRADWRGTIWESHFSNVIHTFWVSLLICVLAIPLVFVGVGVVIIAFVALWFLYRTIRGLIRAVDGVAYE
ncbi:MAG: hypothetical protein KGJ78_17305 [Alphaproteobacteria bacterium]|nr:hypothetical protein [Alphaproteobacteria bacterium]